MKLNLETFDLTQLPSVEDDHFEFKSSRTPPEELKKKLNCAVSGFANAGGGCFVVGVDDNGNADNGLSLKIGRLDIRAWVDQIVNKVEPVPKYDIKLISDPMGRGVIQPDSAVLLVAIHESYAGPHMALDQHYYIRAGAHTVKATHFIVDAIWAKRHFFKPRLTHLFRRKPEQEQTIQLGILALTDSPAVDVKINISPLPQITDLGSLFPIHIPVIDRINPFFFDVSIYYPKNELWEKDLYLAVEYYDLAGNFYPSQTTKIEVSGSVSAITRANDNPAKMVKALESINKVLLKLTIPRENAAKPSFVLSKPSFVLSKPSESIFTDIENLMPELLEQMKKDLREYPVAREFILMRKGADDRGDENNFILQYFFEDHDWLRSKLRILENHALIYEITYNNTLRFVISEELATYLTNC
jgi:hypothetical protein